MSVDRLQRLKHPRFTRIILLAEPFQDQKLFHGFSPHHFVVVGGCYNFVCHFVIPLG